MSGGELESVVGGELEPVSGGERESVVGGVLEPVVGGVLDSVSDPGSKKNCAEAFFRASRLASCVTLIDRPLAEALA